jgi:UMP-CMP kinase
LAEENAINEHHPASMMKNRVIFVLGGPGAGKGTQCAKMVEHFDFVHLSVGDLLRKERAKSPPSENAELIESYLKEGKLVPVSISLALVREAMEREKEGSVFLIDGFPRNDENLDGWTKAMQGVVNVCGVLVYDCPIQELQKRILSRGETSGRSDDNLESAKKRFKTFEGDTMPVVRRMEESGIKSVHIRGENKLEKVWEVSGVGGREGGVGGRGQRASERGGVSEKNFCLKQFGDDRH